MDGPPGVPAYPARESGPRDAPGRDEVAAADQLAAAPDLNPAEHLAGLTGSAAIRLADTRSTNGRPTRATTNSAFVGRRGTARSPYGRPTEA